MYDPDFGNRTSEWFWNMLKSMKLDMMSDENFDEEYVKRAIIKCLERRYTKKGKGGFVTIGNCSCDLRTVDIWRQMCWYLERRKQNG